jgi:hypothetical protein
VRGDDPVQKIDLGRAFRIAFATRSKAGQVIAFQSAPGRWGLVPSALDKQLDTCKNSMI